LLSWLQKEKLQNQKRKKLFVKKQLANQQEKLLQNAEQEKLLLSSISS